AGTVDRALKLIRRDEAQKVAGILGISRLIQADFRDGSLNEQRDQLKAYLASVSEQVWPDLIITYDRAGTDGHPDHVACSEVATELRRERFRDRPLWNVALPRRLERLLIGAGQLTTDAAPAGRRARPTHGVFTGTATVAKMRAVRAYASQRQ